jgi:hypothetical protein
MLLLCVHHHIEASQREKQRKSKPMAAPVESNDISIAPSLALPVKTRDAYIVRMEIGNGTYGNVRA